METKRITIYVDPEAAKVYESAVFEDRQKIDAILGLRLKELARAKKSLEEVMLNVSQKAQARGLTPEIFNDILNE